MAEDMRKVAKEMGLRDNEYDLIVKTLGREPTFTEVGMYAVCLLYTSPSPRDRG